MSQDQMIRNISGRRSQGSSAGFILTVVLWAMFAVVRVYL